MRVVVIGTGYVGLVSGTCFSEFGHQVVCVDKDSDKITSLNNGEIPIYEPGLDTLIARNVAAGRLEFVTDLAAAMKTAEIVFIAVGTPSRRGEGQADLQYVFAAAEEVADYIDRYMVVVTKSTVPVGTGEKVNERIANKNPKADFDVVSNPEFLREGAAIDDFMHPDRIVVGVKSDRAKVVMKELYRPLYLNETPILFTTLESSELIKYASNAFLATKIGFINEMADLCEHVGADVQDVAKGMGLDGRIGSKFLNAGPGYGGSCFPKDTIALLHTTEEFGGTNRIVKAVVESNNYRKSVMADKVINLCNGSVEGLKIAVLGLTFKPNTDDMRDSPALDIIPILQKGGANICAYDPEGMEEAAKLLNKIKYVTNMYDTMDDADVLLIITEWNQFRALNFEEVKKRMNTARLVDLRNIYGRNNPVPIGVDYVGIGR
ncbi:MAG: UDP-glucose/GDP-mannose dehydrogenase family protein [Kordiimonadaceae bacterium]|jgi:UDPglucose 6-dehydrogenase|nr:UDP-glucose/GDP-mannose dehydrogenase family protein [Kordiimonadaceae bacterium]MBT6467315.1 UDP-glucose/GDP-mannose dehydrogenase family protein [Kordiimonadaceae bacterium]MBT7605659.1 UDP-glucose/GDP-mannose dehydrogenase family protein [Kordiimonadaceae bacterium]